MTIGDKIGDEKLQYDINREAAKISALSSSKTDKYEYLTCEEILPSNILLQKKLLKNKRKRLKIKEKNKSKQLKIIKNSQVRNNHVIVNYCFQRKEKYSRIFTTKDLIK